MLIETKHFTIRPFSLDMAQDVHLNSLDADTRRFVPDEVFETIQEAEETLSFLISIYTTMDGPLVYPVFLHNHINIGYVQAVPLNNAQWEIGYHIAKPYTGNGYATEAVTAFLPIIMAKLKIRNILGICAQENIASARVLEKSGFQREFAGIASYHGSDIPIYRYRYSLPE